MELKPRRQGMHPLSRVLLIAPYGIETRAGFALVAIKMMPTNRTLWN